MLAAPLSAQIRAIEADMGPVLVIAGPGAGKTFCLIGRVNHLIGRELIAPERICAVTFTNKAAEEIATLFKTFGSSFLIMRSQPWFIENRHHLLRASIPAWCNVSRVPCSCGSKVHVSVMGGCLPLVLCIDTQV